MENMQILANLWINLHIFCSGHPGYNCHRLLSGYVCTLYSRTGTAYCCQNPSTPTIIDAAAVVTPSIVYCTGNQVTYIEVGIQATFEYSYQTFILIDEWPATQLYTRIIEFWLSDWIRL